MDRKVHVLGILWAHLATVGTLVRWICPEAGDQSVAGPEYLSTGTSRPGIAAKHMLTMPTPSQKPSALEQAAPVAL